MTAFFAIYVLLAGFVLGACFGGAVVALYRSKAKKEAKNENDNVHL